MNAGDPQRIMIIGPLPPPMHGAAVITAMVAEAIAVRNKVVLLNIAPSGMQRGLGYHWTRVRRVMAAVIRVAASGFGSKRGAIYLSAAGGRGLLYNVTLAVCARLLNRPLYIHHHSFAYIDRRDWKMALLAWVAGTRACHLALCSTMELGLRRNYRRATHVRVLSNAAFYAPPANPISPRARGARLRLGFLSNLHRDKGLDLVLETALAAGDTAAALVLAGDPMNHDAETLIAAARTKLGPRLEYRGAVRGGEKAHFFFDIDVFLFPSRYVNEAEPTVIYEAMSAGVPVIAYGRGCIPCQVPEGAGLVIPPSSDFVSAACAEIGRWARDPAGLALASHKAVEAMRVAHEQARAGLMELVAALERTR